MLPNHAPYVIAEQFGTLARLFPGRIDLGLGRAPGTDQLTLRALRRSPEAADNFPQDVLEVQAFLAPAGPNQRIQAVPAAGTEVPLWILGSSNFGAMLAAELGLPYAFASHFAPDLLIPALQIYRSRFKPSEQLDRPYAMVGVNIIAAGSDAEARRLATTQQMSFTNIFRGARGLSQPPIDDIESYWSPAEKAQAMRMLARSIVGSPDTVRAGIDALVAETGADELIDRVRCLRSRHAAALLRTHRRGRRDSAAVATADRDAILMLSDRLNIREQPQPGAYHADDRKKNDDRQEVGTLIAGGVRQLSRSYRRFSHRRSRNPAPQAMGECGKRIGEMPRGLRWRQRQL